MAVISTATWPQLLWPGLNRLWGLTHDKYQTEYTEIFETLGSNKAFEEDQQLVGAGQFPVLDQGAGVTYDTASQGFTERYTHVQYGKGLVITEIMYEDNVYGRTMKMLVETLSDGCHDTRETVAANVLNNGFTTTRSDGVALLATNHPYAGAGGGTWANKPTVDADLSEAAVEAACIAISQWKNDRGLQMMVKPQKLLVSSSLPFDAKRILDSVLRVGTANNDLNALKAMGSIPQGFAVNHFFSDADAWFIKTNRRNGFTHFNRRPDKMARDSEFDTGNLKAKVTTRYSFGATDPHCVYGSQGA